jgi:hypothetical protein
MHLHHAGFAVTTALISLVGAGSAQPPEKTKDDDGSEVRRAAARVVGGVEVEVHHDTGTR